MMKIAVFVSLFTLSIGTAMAQTAADSIPKFDPKVKSALNMSDQMVYQAALRYSDLAIAKQKLYDLMARNPCGLTLFPVSIHWIQFFPPISVCL